MTRRRCTKCEVEKDLANRLKNDGTAEQHEQIAQWMRQNQQ